MTDKPTKAKVAKPKLTAKALKNADKLNNATKRSYRLNEQLTETPEEIPVNPDHILEVRTVNGTTLRNIIESLKNVLDDANFYFTNKGIHVTMADNHEICACLLTMNASFFERYHCDSAPLDKLTLGIDPREFYKLLKDVNGSTTVTLSLHKDHRHVLHVVLDNLDTGVSSDSELILRNLDSEHWIMDNNSQLEFAIDPPEIPSSELQRIFRQFHVLHGKEVEITHYVRPEKDIVEFKLIGGDINKTERISVLPAEGEENLRPEPTQVSARFLLYHLKQITNAATRISPKIRLSLRQDNCMHLEYVLTGNDNRLRYLLFQVQLDE